MSRALRFAALLVAGLGLLTWGGLVIVQRTTRAWFEKDVALRSQLVFNGSRRVLAPLFENGNSAQLGDLLTDITHDERILGAAGCTPELGTLTQTRDYPPELGCETLGAELRRDLRREGQDGKVEASQPWTAVRSLPVGEAFVTALPVVRDDKALGFLVLVHDLSWMERREEKTRFFLFTAFGVLALCASIITLVASRLSWRGWSNELRRLLQGGTERPEFQPLLQDVRSLVDRLAEEREGDEQRGPWTPQRLKQTLRRHLSGERVICVANREPYIHERTAEGLKVLHPASGLVTALEPVMRACSGVWVAHGSGSADRETSDRQGRVRVPPGEESYLLRRVWLTREEEKGYYYGFSNEGLWPLCHTAHTRPNFHIEDWKHYQTVNRRFADAVCTETDSEDPIILVQDYHFALVPRLIRERLPRATVITFWHIPWPNAERYGICPWRNELLEGLLGSSIVGFHTQQHCNNFVEAVDRYMEARIDREQVAVVHNGHTSLVRPYPISIEWPNRWVDGAPPPAECRASVFGELGLGPDALLGVGVDRLDYTKGIEERLLAVERMLERTPSLRGRFTFAQLAAPSRTAIEAYQRLNDNVERLAVRINERFGQGSYRPVILHRAHHEPPTVMRYLRAADLCYVSSLHDGMNLVAKEFIAARSDERGVLVLSQFTGAARELTESLVVNPYDIEQSSAAMARALHMPREEQQARMRAMRALVRELNVYRWAGRMLVDAARLRNKERLRGRFSDERLTLEGAA